MDDEWPSDDDGDDDGAWGEDNDTEQWGDDTDEKGWGSGGEGSDDDMGDGMGEIAPPTLTRQSSLVILNQEDLWGRMQTKITNVVEMLGIEEEEAIVLLRHYGWDDRKLTDVYISEGDALRLELGLDVPNPMPAPSEEVECPQCMGDFEPEEVHSLKCGHFSCRECWTEYINYQCQLGEACVKTHCNYHKCPLLVPQDVFEKFATPKNYGKYRRWLARSYINGTRGLIWCPAPGCEFAVESQSGSAQEVQCRCGFRSCFKCGLPSHIPASCEDIEKWNLKANSEAENSTWILANTKICPPEIGGCGKRIEKNQGCNHMTCKCGFEFCWLCKGKWSEHGSATGGYYKCNIFEKKKQEGNLSKEEKAQKDAKSELERYMFYYERADSHEKAAKYAEKTLAEVELQIPELQKKTGANYSQMVYVLDAVKEVIACRNVLKYTYAKGYYITDPTTKNLYESLQQNLEKFTESLHHLTENKTIEEITAPKFRQDIVGLTRTICKWRKEVATAMSEGVLNV